jgi:hypothetical protein
LRIAIKYLFKIKLALAGQYCIVAKQQRRKMMNYEEKKAAIEEIRGLIAKLESYVALNPPKGYRIVSMTDRERCEYPTDCKVMYKADREGCFWVESDDDLGWNDIVSDDYCFAVPSDYVFAEDRPAEKRYERREYPAKLLIRQEVKS